MSVALPYREDVKQWSVEQLAAWLQQREMPDIADIYLRKGIDGHKLITLAEGEHITILNSLSLRERLDLLNIIKKIKNQPSKPNLKSQLERPSQNNNYRKPTTVSNTTNVNNYRHSTQSNSSENSLYGENEIFNSSSVPYIDETANEDYLVPLSTGMGVLPPDPQPQIKPKKERCPSPPLHHISKSRERNKIQNLELPEPPINQKKVFIQQYLDSNKKYMGNKLFGDKGNKEDGKTENKEDFNAYEIIQEGPTDSETKSADIPEVDRKPPNLPYRNFAPPATTPPPAVPVRTHASTQHQHPTLLKFPLRPSEPSQQSHQQQAAPRAVAPQPLHKPATGQVGGNLSKIKSKFPSDGVRGGPLPLPSEGANIRGGRVDQLPLPSLEVLQLDSSKSVPMNNLYRSLLDRDYFHPVARNAVADMLIEDGMFLVRPSTHSQHLLTLSISNNGKIYNIVIRTRGDSKFALGNEKPYEHTFTTVDDIIKFHRKEPIKVEEGFLVYLRRTPSKDTRR